MNALFGTLLFVFPGLLGMIISEWIGPGRERPLTDFEKTLFGVVFNIPILVSIWVGIKVMDGIWVTNIPLAESLFGKVEFDFLYALSAIALAFLYAVFWVNVGRGLLLVPIKWIRAWRGLPPLSHESPMEHFWAGARHPILEICDLGSHKPSVRAIVDRVSHPSISNLTISLEDDEYLGWLDVVDVQPCKVLVVFSESKILKRYEAQDINAAVKKHLAHTVSAEAPV